MGLLDLLKAPGKSFKKTSQNNGLSSGKVKNHLKHTQIDQFDHPTNWSVGTSEPETDLLAKQGQVSECNQQQVGIQNEELTILTSPYQTSTGIRVIPRMVNWTNGSLLRTIFSNIYSKYIVVRSLIGLLDSIGTDCLTSARPLDTDGLIRRATDAPDSVFCPTHLS